VVIYQTFELWRNNDLFAKIRENASRHGYTHCRDTYEVIDTTGPPEDFEEEDIALYQEMIEWFTEEGFDPTLEGANKVLLLISW
jgi:hypothetical protein